MGKSEQGIQQGRGRYTVIPRVLVFLYCGEDVLLLKGAADKRIWANRYNGVGGHVEAGEDFLHAARRETQEETGIDPQGLRFEGLINIDGGEDTGILLAVFTAHTETRETIASDEGTLEWMPLANLADLDLVEDIPVLLQRIARRQHTAPGQRDQPPFFARYWYDAQDQLQIAFAEGH
jgi:8-oxo-dGTP diphosphatase